MVVPDEIIMSKIYFLRGHKVMLDKDLAELYGVETKVFNQSVKRNLKRFPSDFMFTLSEKETENLRSQIVTSSWGGTRYLPNAFTGQGVAMLASILNSDRAIAVNIQIVRIFTKVREMLSTHKDVLEKLDKMEREMLKQNQRSATLEKEIQLIFQTIKQLLDPPLHERRKIGYKKSSDN
jgi:hypothetical protein